MVNKTKKIEFDHLVKILRKSSVYVADFLNKFNIHPNQVTVGRFFIFVIPALICFYIGNYFLNFLGILLLFFNFYFDLVDGDLARNYNKKSKLGPYLENLIDPLVLNLVILTIILNLIQIDSNYIYIGLFCFFGQKFSSDMTNLFKYRFSIDCVEGSLIIEKSIKKFNIFENFLINLITPKNFFLSFFSNFRYYLVLGSIFNVIPLALFIYTIAINLRWIILDIYLVLYYSSKKIKKLDSIFLMLKELEKDI